MPFFTRNILSVFYRSTVDLFEQSGFAQFDKQLLDFVADFNVTADGIEAEEAGALFCVFPVHNKSAIVARLNLRIRFSITGKHTLAEVSRWPIVAVVRNVGGQVS